MLEQKQVITDLISYFTTQNIIGLTYAEAIDADTVAQLNITITNNLENGDKNVPAKRVSLLDCNESTKHIIKQVLQLLSQEDSVGFHYEFRIPDSPMQLMLCVELKQVDTTLT